MEVEDYFLETRLNQWVENLIVELSTKLWKTRLKSAKSIIKSNNFRDKVSS